MTTQVRNSTLLWGATAKPTDWEAVYVEQLPRVYNFLRYRIGNEAMAEELTSRTFEKAWRERHRYRPDLAGASTWLLRIARNTAIDHHRTSGSVPSLAMVWWAVAHVVVVFSIAARWFRRRAL